MFHDVIQNSPEWYDLRIGKITGSHFGSIMANEGKVFGNPAQDYAIQVALERSTGRRFEVDYTNHWMQRGHELEPIARSLYELETMEFVDNGGIYVDGDFATSPDGLVNDNGQIEIKSVKYNTHFERIKKGGFDLKYKWQIQGNLWLSGRDWCDFISYCPDYPENKQLYVFRVVRDQEMIDRLKQRLNEFNNKVKENLKQLW